MPLRLRMDLLLVNLLSGCPVEAMLAIAEVSALAQWKPHSYTMAATVIPSLSAGTPPMNNTFQMIAGRSMENGPER